MTRKASYAEHKIDNADVGDQQRQNATTQPMYHFLPLRYIKSKSRQPAASRFGFLVLRSPLVVCFSDSDSRKFHFTSGLLVRCLQFSSVRGGSSRRACAAAVRSILLESVQKRTVERWKGLRQVELIIEVVWHERTWDEKSKMTGRRPAPHHRDL